MCPATAVKRYFAYPGSGAARRVVPGGVPARINPYR